MDEFDEMDFDELEKEFAMDEEEMKKTEDIVLTQNLEGFASCFPKWDLTPPRN